MGSMYCRECDAVHLGKPCFPIFTVIDEDGDEFEVRAVLAEFAAERWAELNDPDNFEFAIISGSARRVKVIDSEGVSSFFSVSGETVPSYTATEINVE